MPTFKVDMVAFVPAVATVYVDAIDEENAREIAITSCCIDDFDIVDLGTIETMEVTRHD